MSDKEHLFDEARGERDYWRTEAAELIRERDFLADQVSKLETIIDEKQDTLDALSEENDSLKDRIETYEYDNAALRSRADWAWEKLKDAREKISDLTDYNDRLIYEVRELREG